MAKQGEHKHDANDKRISKGPNNPSKSQPMHTGAPKKRETYKKQAALHDNPGKHPRSYQRRWNGDTRDYPTKEEAHEARKQCRRTGSDSNQSKATRGY
jgi:hypothetical protein